MIKRYAKRNNSASMNSRFIKTWGVEVTRFLNVLVLFGTALSLIFVAPLTALAATPSAGQATNGYRSSPVRTDLSVAPGNSEVVPVYLQNASSAVEHVQTIVDDFEAPTDESGNPVLLLNGATAPTHSLKRFVTVQNPTFTLQPGQQMTVNIMVKVPSGTAGGGYYGAVRFAPVGSNGDKNVNLSASVASLILLTVPGNLVEQVSIAGFGVAQGANNNIGDVFLNNKHLHVIARFNNTGNVQEQPFGKILLKRGSHGLQSITINNGTPPGNVLPSSIRLFSYNLTKVGSFGKYRVEGNFGYGSKGQLLTATATFWVIPVVFIIIAVLLILLILFLIFGLPRLIRRYNRRVIARANRQNHQPPSHHQPPPRQY